MATMPKLPIVLKAGPIIRGVTIPRVETVMRRPAAIIIVESVVTPVISRISTVCIPK
jgi:hypothetical protein